MKKSQTPKRPKSPGKTVLAETTIMPRVGDYIRSRGRIFQVSAILHNPGGATEAFVSPDSISEAEFDRIIQSTSARRSKPEAGPFRIPQTK